MSPSKGSVLPSLGAGAGSGALPGVGSCSPSCGVWPGSLNPAAYLLFFPFLGFLSLGSFLGFGVFTCFAFLGFFPGGDPMDPPSPPSGPGAGRFFGHAPRSSSLSGSSSGVVALSGEIMHLRMTIFHPPFEFDGLIVRIFFINIWEHGFVAVEAMLLSKVIDELINHPVSPLSTNQGSLHPGSHAVVGEPFHKTSHQVNL